MRTAVDLLSQYAQSHRDRRNIVSHFIGVPMVVFSVGVLLARPEFALPSGTTLTPAWMLFALAAAWYVTRGELVLGLAVSVEIAALVWAGQRVAQGSVASWLVWGLGFFVVGWVIQFVGHWYEGKKPAFTNDLVGLLVGPMFVSAEGMFMLGWNRPLQQSIERRAGPTMLRDMARIA